MKKIGKITLAKSYDVLSENEMKRIVGGMGSGSGSAAVLMDCGTLAGHEYSCRATTRPHASHNAFHLILAKHIV